MWPMLSMAAESTWRLELCTLSCFTARKICISLKMVSVKIDFQLRTPT